MGPDTRQFVIAVAIVAALAVASPTLAAQAPAAPSVEFHIASQPLAQALNAWAQQCGLQLIWPAGSDAARMQSRPLQGKFEPLQALQLLLQDSGLKYSVLSEGTVTLEGRNASKSTVISVRAEGEGE